MGFRSRLAEALLLLLPGLVLGAGCAVPEGPELVTVSTVSPGLVEPGGALQVGGRGFPAGRTGQVELRGTSLVPGRDPEQVTVHWTGQAVSSVRLVASLGAEQVTALTSGAPHATFRGRLSVSFEPVRAGAPALRGHTKDVTLDVLAPAAAPELPPDFAEYLGLGLGSDLSVVSVAEGQEAQAAGLRIGDRLHRLDGVKLLTTADFAPRAHARASLLEFSRPGYAGRAEVLLGRADYFRSDESVIWFGISVGVAVLVGLLAAARPPRVAVWLLQTKRGTARKTTSLARAIWWRAGLRAALGTAGFWLLSRMQQSAFALDLPLLAGSSMAALLLSVLLLDGRRAQGGFALFSGLWGASMAALGLLPLLLGWGLAAIEGGSLALADLTASQQSAPLGAGLLGSPWILLSGIAYLLALVPLGGERSPTGVPTRRAPFVRALEEFGVLLALLLWVILYGGALHRHFPPAVALATSFVELLLLSAVLDWTRCVGGRASRGESWDLLVRPLAITSVGAALVRLLLLRLELDTAWDAKLRWLPFLCLLSVCVWLTLSAFRSLSHHGRRADPWL